jgi:uncharacterized protein (UPF0147 family)
MPEQSTWQQEREHRHWLAEWQRAEREVHAAKTAARSARAAAKVAATNLGTRDLASATLARDALARLERISEDLRTAKETRDAVQARLTALESATRLGIREHSLATDILAILLLVAGAGLAVHLAWSAQPAGASLAGGLSGIGLLLGWRRLLIGSFSNAEETALREALTEADAALERTRDRLRVIATGIGLRVDEPLMINEFRLLIARILEFDRCTAEEAREAAKLEVELARHQHVCSQLAKLTRLGEAATADAPAALAQAVSVAPRATRPASDALGTGLVHSQQRGHQKQDDDGRQAQPEGDRHRHRDQELRLQRRLEYER